MNTLSLSSSSSQSWKSPGPRNSTFVGQSIARSCGWVSLRYKTVGQHRLKPYRWISEVVHCTISHELFLDEFIFPCGQWKPFFALLDVIVLFLNPRPGPFCYCIHCFLEIPNDCVLDVEFATNWKPQTWGRSCWYVERKF